jgi:UDP-glucuronate 4-epimerase
MAFYYSNAFSLRLTGLRFFTVYGPWGRPDMAYSKFTNSILRGESVKIYGNDGGLRNMTHVNDVTETIMRLINVLKSSNFSSEFGFQIYNVASTNSISALDLAGSIGNILDKEVNYEFIERPPGDAIATKADLTKISKLVGLPNPRNMLVDIANYTAWHRKYMKYFPK